MEPSNRHQESSEQPGEAWMDGESGADAGANGGAAAAGEVACAAGSLGNGWPSAVAEAPRALLEAEALELSHVDRIAQLPSRWMQLFVAAMFDCHGNVAAARRRAAQVAGTAAVSLWSIEQACAKFPEFAALMDESRREADYDLVGAVYKGATEGDEQPIFQQGVKVGSRRVRSPKDAELYMKYRGMISDEPAARANIRVTVQQGTDVPERAAAVAELLFRARAALPPLLDAATGQPV